MNLIFKFDFYRFIHITISMNPHIERSNRSDGEKTRALLLDAAGRVFANRGYSEATSKEICNLAKTNTAAVNYYFGGKDNLYKEVLIEAHKQLVDIEYIKKISLLKLPPEKKLSMLVSQLLKTCRPSTGLWGIKVCLRELTAPSPFLPGMIKDSVIPKSMFIKQLISEIIGYPPGSPQVQHAVAFVILPCLGLVLFPENFRLMVLPSTKITDKTMASEMIRYIIAGLESLKK